MDRVKIAKANQLEQEILWLNDITSDIDYHCEGIRLYKKDDELILGIWKDYRIFCQIKKAIVDELKREIICMEDELDKL